MTRGRIPQVPNYSLTDWLYIDVGPLGGSPAWKATPISNFFKRGNVLQGLPYNVMHYGAVIDGTTDDSAAVQATIDAAEAAGGGIVHCGNGDIAAVGLTIDSPNVSLVGGPDCQFVRTAATLFVTVLWTATNTSISGIAFDLANQAERGILLDTGVEDITIESCRFSDQNAGSAAVHASGGTKLNKRIRVLNCNFSAQTGTTATQSALLVTNFHDCLVQGNSFLNGGGVKAEANGLIGDDAEGIVISNNTFRSIDGTNIFARPNAATTLRNVVISENSFFEVGLSTSKVAIGAGSQASGAGGITEGITISNNLIRSVGIQGIQIGDSTDASTVLNVTVSNNVIDGRDLDGAIHGGNSCGIRVFKTTATRNIIIDSNAIYYTDVGGIVLGNGVSHAVISNNTIDHACQNKDGYLVNLEGGIYIEEGTHIVISGNQVRNTGAVDMAAGVGGIALGAKADVDISDMVIVGNIVTDDRGTPYQDYGIRIGRTAIDATQPKRIMVAHNYVSGSATDDIKVFATVDKENLVWGNTVADEVVGAFMVFELDIDGDLNHDGDNVGLYGTAPTGQAANIANPAGGVTVDAEARAAIDAIIAALEGIGISAA